MLDLIYSEELRKLFTNREKELALLQLVVKDAEMGKQPRISFFGLRRIGKSLLLKEFLRRNQKNPSVRIAYLNLEEFATNPEDFALNYVGRTCYWVFGGKRLEDFLTPEGLAASVPSNLREKTLRFAGLLQRQKSNRVSLLNEAFSFPFFIAKSKKKKVILLLDEFQELLDLKKFKDCRNILGLFRSKIEAEGVSYVIAGSASSVMHDLVASKDSPLFNQFREEQLMPFDKISTRTLVGKIIGIRTELKDFVYALAHGQPFYTQAIASKARLLEKILDIEVNRNALKQAFVIEALSPKGSIYRHCSYVFEVSIEKAKYSNSLKSVLKILAREEGLSQSHVARKLRVTQGAARTYLNALIEVDVLSEKDNAYYFNDPVLRYWLSKRELGIELSEFPKKKVIEQLLSELEEKYLKASSELGKAKEFELKEKLGSKLNLELKNYRSKNGKTEFDLVGEKNKVHYILEIKWKNKPAALIGLKKFFEKAKKSEFKSKRKELFFVSKNGFTKKATEYAERNKIRLLNGKLRELKNA